MFENLLITHAREKFGLPADWHCYQIKSMDSVLIPSTSLTGRVAPSIQRGANKGQPNWKKGDKRTEATVTLTDDEHSKWLLEWEKVNGSCHLCQGSGKRCVGWSKASGKRYKTCNRCGGDGSPVVG